MANVRLKNFETYPLFGAQLNLPGSPVEMPFCGYYFPGSISFNQVAVVLGVAAAATRTISYSGSLGLYSLNAGTLSLANSALLTLTLNTIPSQRSWYTMVTSATQDITPGIWWLAYTISTATAGGAGNHENLRWLPNIPGLANAVAMGGPFLRGRMTVSTTGLPVSVATSDLLKEHQGGSTNEFRYPYILISA